MKFKTMFKKKFRNWLFDLSLTLSSYSVSDYIWFGWAILIVVANVTFIVCKIKGII